MKKLIRGAAALLAGWLATSTPILFAQDLAAGEPNLPLPLYHARPDAGGFFISGSYSMYRQTNPIKSQTVAYRGFYAIDGTNLGPQAISGTGASSTIVASDVLNRDFIGSMSDALNTSSVSGPSSYMPGFKIEGGWKFADESSLTMSYLWLAKANYASTASLIPPNLNISANGADGYLSSPVYGYPSQYAGPINDIFAFADPGLARSVRSQGGTVPSTNVPTANGTPGPVALEGFRTPFAGYGIWNAADFMTLEFTQRFQQLEMTYRKPVYETDDYRLTAMVGPRFAWVWERFKWIATDLNLYGEGNSLDAAAYTNIVSNRMYGVHAGLGQEWYLGHGLTAQVDLQAALFMNVVKERAKYEFDIKNATPISKRSKTVYTIVPEIQPTVGMAWYPVEGIEFKINYDVMMFFNTISSPNPVNFSWGGLDPTYTSTFRIFDGFNAGVALVF